MRLLADTSSTAALTPVQGRAYLQHGSVLAAQTPGTPQECATMVNAVEEAIKNAQDITPGAPLHGLTMTTITTPPPASVLPQKIVL